MRFSSKASRIYDHTHVDAVGVADEFLDGRFGRVQNPAQGVFGIWHGRLMA